MNSLIHHLASPVIKTLDAQAGCIPSNAWEHIQIIWAQLPDFLRRYALKHQRRYMQTPHCPMKPATGVEVLRNSGQEAELKMGDFHFSFDKSRQELAITDRQTGETTKIWGDPHYQDSNGQRAADIHGDTITVLRDGTRIFVDTTNAQGHQERDPHHPSYAGRVGIIRPDGSTVFVDHLTGPDALRISTPPPGQLPLDFLMQRMRDFQPEAVLRVVNGHWTDAHGHTLNGHAPTQVGGDRIAELARDCMAHGIYPRAACQRDDFDFLTGSPGWQAALQAFEMVLRRLAPAAPVSLIPMLHHTGQHLLMRIGSHEGASEMGHQGRAAGEDFGLARQDLPTLVLPWMRSSL